MTSGIASGKSEASRLQLSPKLSQLQLFPELPLLVLFLELGALLLATPVLSVLADFAIHSGSSTPIFL
jgi:hypothetical protein